MKTRHCRIWVVEERAIKSAMVRCDESSADAEGLRC